MMTSLLTKNITLTKVMYMDFTNLNNKEVHKIQQLNTFRMNCSRSLVLPHIVYQRGDNSN